ncbi:type IX secretion system outer membrane channel protein PorV [Rhodohalobacter sp. 614A]|uniref:type IX secretion system outer membrane channel protein PorV n=1 Tax=Rhodohalobacter sp. 614A TaxID=2908649 RepID=UPI001F33FB9E|nr:type IX secretion system outer membrane channel protein PorV [Rhodohalobacter sp. 614A]
MKTKKIHIVLLFVVLFAPVSVTAQIGITAVPFLQIEPDSRAAGMGNTGVAIADNASAVFWNPAGLAFQNQNQISVTHANWLPAFNVDLFYDYLAGTYHIEDIGTFGAHITYLNLGEQIRTDETGFDRGRFRSFEVSGGISYGLKISDRFSLGTGVRFIYSSLADGSVSGQDINPGASVGVDLSALYKSNPIMWGERESNISVGINLSNFGPGIQYTDNTQTDPLPTALRIGWAYTMDLDKQGKNTLTFSNDISKILARRDAASSFEALYKSWNAYDRFNGKETITVSFGEQLMYGFGAEYWYNNLFSLRSGYYYEHPKNGNREFLTLGAGIRYKLFGVDFSYLYTFEEDHPLANTIRLSLLINI